MPERLALYPGSFDPITLGHVDILRRAQRLFDEVVILVADGGKAGFWTAAQRADIWRQCLQADSDLQTSEVAVFAGLLVDEVRQRGACVVVRGVRSARDYEQEWSLHGVNCTLLADFETVWLPARADLAAISSSLVREAARYGGRLDGLVPGPVAVALAAKPPR
jgi:pantetheine-phosphate adenylyltransferase